MLSGTPSTAALVFVNDNHKHGGMHKLAARKDKGNSGLKQVKMARNKLVKL